MGPSPEGMNRYKAFSFNSMPSSRDQGESRHNPFQLFTPPFIPIPRKAVFIFHLKAMLTGNISMPIIFILFPPIIWLPILFRLFPDKRFY